MNVVYAPIPLCRTRMRRHHNFGKDDPAYWPQPFDWTIGHLAVLPSPTDSTLHPLYYAWYQPTAYDFVHMPDTGLTGIGRLDIPLDSQMRDMCSKLLIDIQSMPDGLKNDPPLVRSRGLLRVYLERLQMPGSRNRVFLQLACLQRVFLETYARWQWVMNWKPRWKDVDRCHEVDRRLMGAFTDRLDIAADLFRVGIPVWLVRGVEDYPTTRIDAMVAPLDETETHQLQLRDFEFPIDVSDDNHPVIYTGLPGKYLRYTEMASFIQHQLSYSIIGSFDDAQSHQTQGSLTSSSTSSTTPIVSAIPRASHSNMAAMRAETKELDLISLTLRDWISVPQAHKRQRTGMCTELELIVRC